MHRADSYSLPAVLARADGFAQPVITNLDDAVLVKDVARLQVTMDDAAVVEILQALGDLAEKKGRLLRAQPCGALVDHLPQVWPGDILHNDKGPAKLVIANVKNAHQVLRLEVHALRDAPKLNLLVALHHFECHFAARV